MHTDSSDSEVPTMKATAARAAPAKRGTRGKKIQPTDEAAARHSQPTETDPEIAASKNPSAKRPVGRARKQAPSSEPPADDTDTEGPTKKVPAARAAPAKRGARAKKTQPTEELSDEENVPPEVQSQKRGAAPAKKAAPRKGAASKKAPPTKDDLPTLTAYDEFRPSARPGTQRYRLEQMAFLTAQNDAAQPDDLFGGCLLDSGAGGGGGGLLGLADGELMAAVTPLAPGRGGGRRPAAHSSLTPVAALAAGGAYSVKTPTMATSTISPGNPLNSVHRDEAARYMVNRKKQAGPARQRLRMGTDRPAAPSFSGSSDIDSAARLIEEDAAWLLREDDPSDEPADEYFDYDG
ncbi:translation initiation factor IF-2-like [Amphibalanus amphitrite]|uniref:translation initiation factor IF-2-like n=1 Tax=Amphibalanus amphitrite TaxID=1232801 RepID=UPI001C917373|nr:translation initiation factor IF-2-like [Amphibalanus amphitrite]